MNDNDLPISKTQRKRDAEALQQLGQQLTQLNLTQIESLNLPEALNQAILLHKSLKAHGAKRRQMQFIGKIMRQIDDIDSIQKAYEILVQGNVDDANAFKLIEHWRDRLLANAAELDEFMIHYPSTNKKELSALIAKAKNEQAAKKSHGSAKALFRQIKSIISKQYSV